MMDGSFLLGLVQPLETQEFLLSGFYYDWRSRQKIFASMTSESASTGECDLTEGTATQLDVRPAKETFCPHSAFRPFSDAVFYLKRPDPEGLKQFLSHTAYGIVGSTLIQAF
jgi:hypothetical protein